MHSALVTPTLPLLPTTMYTYIQKSQVNAITNCTIKVYPRCIILYASTLYIPCSIELKAADNTTITATSNPMVTRYVFSNLVVALAAAYNLLATTGTMAPALSHLLYIFSSIYLSNILSITTASTDTHRYHYACSFSYRGHQVLAAAYYYFACFDQEKCLPTHYTTTLVLRVAQG